MNTKNHTWSKGYLILRPKPRVSIFRLQFVSQAANKRKSDALTESDTGAIDSIEESPSKRLKVCRSLEPFMDIIDNTSPIRATPMPCKKNRRSPSTR